MPVHFNSFIPDEEKKLQDDLFANIVVKYTQNANDIFITEDKRKIHMTSFFKDKNLGENIGKVVITLIVREKELEVVDVDITILNSNKIKLYFENKLRESSEANEYYEVYELDEKRHFQIETVNRYSLLKEEIEGTEQEVYLSCFPFQLEIFENENEMNEKLGFGKEIDIPVIGKKVIGLDYHMMAAGGIMTSATEPCSFIVGKIVNYKDVEVVMADISLKFTIINLETAVGILPVVANEKNFDLRKIGKNKVVCMVANVKADFK